MSRRLPAKRQQAPRRRPDTPLSERAWLNLTETAEWFALHPRTITRMIANGEIPERVMTRFGRSIRINRPALEQWLAERDAA